MKKRIVLCLVLFAALLLTACSGTSEPPITTDTQPPDTTEPIIEEELEPEGEFIDFMPLTFVENGLPDGRPPEGMVPSKNSYDEKVYTVFGRKAKIVETVYSAYTGETAKYYQFIDQSDKSVFFSFTADDMKLSYMAGLDDNDFIGDNAIISEHIEDGVRTARLYMLKDGEVKTADLSSLILEHLSDGAYGLSFGENRTFTYRLPGDYEGGEITVKCYYRLNDKWLVICEELIRTVEPAAPFDSDSEEWSTETEFTEDGSYVLRVNGPDGLSFEYGRDELGYDPHAVIISSELIVHPTLNYAALVYTGEMSEDMQIPSTFCTVISLKNGEIISHDRGIYLDDYHPDEMTCTYEYLKKTIEDRVSAGTMSAFSHFAEPTEQGFEIKISMLQHDGKVIFGGLKKYLVLLRETGEVMFDYVKTDDGTVTITGYTGEDPVILIPSHIEDCEVTAVSGFELKEGQTVSYIRIPSTVTEIGPRAFAGCVSVERIVMADSVLSVGDGAFEGCTSLKRVTLSKGLVSIGEDAFRGCTSLTDIDLPDSLSAVGSRAFYGCTSLKKIYIPEGVFDGNTFEMFMNSGLETVTFGRRVRSVDALAFSGTPLREIVLPDSINKIEKGAFYNCKELTSVTLGNRLVMIGDLAFAGTGITKIIIPKIVRYMNETVFYFCTALEEVRFDGIAPENYISDRSLGYLNPDYTVYYHATSEGFTFPEWNGYKSKHW
ncbi:MAG: leucine-rich repeat domain-containing protein [Clostridia bacterium]|nr:leucine-rich repeat domain-containing protein [Clostridia bacterium]